MHSCTYKLLTATLIRQGKIKEGLVFEEKGRSQALAQIILNSCSVQPAKIIGAKLSNFCQIREVAAGLDSTLLYLSLNNGQTYIWVIQPNGDVELKVHKHGIGMSQLSWLISNARQAQRVPYGLNCEDRSLTLLYPDELVETTELESTVSLAATPANATAAKSKGFYDCSPSSIDVEKGSKHMTAYAARQGTDEKQNSYEEDDSRISLHGPVRELIQGSHVVIVPEGELHLVPYAALKDDKGHYVAETLQMRLVQSIVTAKMMRDFPQLSKGEAGPCVIGDPETGKLPRLPFARKEALEIGKLLNVRPLTGKDATKQKVLECIENASLIHIAAHGDMKRGEILFAPSHGKERKKDCMLMASDFDSKCLKAKLVVLSCCHSARGELVKSEGVVGIARAVLGAGARSVLISLWPIEDEATMSLMKSFYKHLKSGKKANESLSLAMTTIREIKKFCKPRHWAPFVLIGDNVTI